MILNATLRGVGVELRVLAASQSVRAYTSNDLLSVPAIVALGHNRSPPDCTAARLGRAVPRQLQRLLGGGRIEICLEGLIFQGNAIGDVEDFVDQWMRECSLAIDWHSG